MLVNPETGERNRVGLKEADGKKAPRVRGQQYRCRRQGCEGDNLWSSSMLSKDTIVPELMKKLGYKTTMQARVAKITLNMGVAEAVNDKKPVDAAAGDMTKIRTEPNRDPHPQGSRELRSAKTSTIGCMVTLCGERIYDFPDRLVTVASRVRDFVVSPVVLSTAAAETQPRSQGTDHLPGNESTINHLRGKNNSITPTAKSERRTKLFSPVSASRSATEVDAKWQNLLSLNRQSPETTTVAKYAAKRAASTYLTTLPAR